jgi:hypothetical protein
VNRRNFEPTNRRVRAAAYRADAAECEDAGFTVFAQVNREMADLLDPPTKETADAAADSDS